MALTSSSRMSIHCRAAGSILMAKLPEGADGLARKLDVDLRGVLSPLSSLSTTEMSFRLASMKINSSLVTLTTMGSLYLQKKTRMWFWSASGRL